MNAQLQASDTWVSKPQYRMSDRGNEKPTCSIGPQIATSAPLTSVTLVGRLASSKAKNIQLRLILPLNLQIEDDEDGGAIVSDSLFGIYGEGKDFNAAVEDYRSALMDFYFLLRERSERSSEDAALYAGVNRYIEEISPRKSTTSAH